MSDEMERYTMRTNVVQDGIWMRAKCLVHANCRAAGKMVFPSGRKVDLKTKTGDIKDLNANFVSHLEKRDKVDGTSHADTWRKGLIHGPRAPFTVPYEPTNGGGEPDAEDGAVEADIEAPSDGQRDTAIALAAARTAATAVANVLGAARERDHLAAAQTALAVAAPRPDDRCTKSELCSNVRSHRGRCNKKRKRPMVENA